MNALILVDIQVDFLPGGLLAVPDGDKVIPVANEQMKEFELVTATQDWHPANHGSFASQHEGKEVGELIDLEGLEQVLWPDHCVQGTKGAEFGPGLDTSGIDEVVRKGTDPSIDSYSGFYDNGHRKATGLSASLKEKGVTDAYIMGLATDYCVKFTALDAVQEGFRTHLILEGCRGIDMNPGDCDKAVEEMKQAGVVIYPIG